MITFKTKIAEARRLVRANPSAVEAIDAAEAEAARAQADEARTLIARRAKVDRAIDERAAQLAADYTARQTGAILDAARRLARAQLERDFGVTPPNVPPPPVLLPEGHVVSAFRRLTAVASVPWRKGESAEAARSSLARAAAEDKSLALTSDDVAQRVADREAQLRAQRERRSASRKAAAGIPGWTATE